jgi:hypothetical protein
MRQYKKLAVQQDREIAIARGDMMEDDGALSALESASISTDNAA